MTSDITAALQRIVDGERASSVESYTIDFKEEASSASETEKLLRDAAICFANSDGGTIVLGVDDDASGPEAFTGTEFDAQIAQRRIYELTQPSILVTSDELTFSSARLLVISVPPQLRDPRGPAGPCTASSRHGLLADEPAGPGDAPRGAAGC